MSRVLANEPKGATAAAAALTLAVWVGAAALAPAHAQDAGPSSAADLPECEFFVDETPPDRPVTGFVPPDSQGPMVDKSDRLPPPSTISGTFENDAVTIAFPAVEGGEAYKVWRNEQLIAWIDDWQGLPSFEVVDREPCRNANYTVVALDDRTQSWGDTIGQLSAPHQLSDDGILAPGNSPRVRR